MKHKTLFLLLLIFSITIKLNAQPGSPPKPLDNSFFNLIEGMWTGQSEMMGVKMNETLVCKMEFNKQYLIINLTAASEDKTHSYSGMGVYGCDALGNVTSWWFDEWGVEGVSTGTGKIDALTMKLNSESAFYTMDRTMELSGGQLVMKWTSTSKNKEGENQTLQGETVYTKAK